MGPLSTEEQHYFKTADGLLVREVVTDGAADRSGLIPGDVLKAAGSEALTQPEDLAGAVQSWAEPVPLSAVRAGRPLTLTLTARTGTGGGTPEEGAGVRWASQAPSLDIASVRTGSAAAAAGLEPSDRLLRVDLAPARSVDQMKRLFERASRRPMWVEVARDGRRLGMLVQ